jgi:CBS-domain-containing membrane protein
MHPPSAATAMLAVLGNYSQIQELGMAYAGTCGAAATLVVGTGLVWNNVVGKKYPA